MKRILKKFTFLFALIIITPSCGNDTKSKDNLAVELKPSVKSDAKKVCELVSNIKLAISEVSNAINDGAEEAEVEALNDKAKAINMRIKEIQKRNYGNKEFMKLQQSCYEAMNK
jgi:hypothetical protein